MATLLEKMRKINGLLQQSKEIEYNKLSQALSSVIDANVYIVGRHGRVYGYAFVDGFECELMFDKVINPGRFPAKYVRTLLTRDETCANLCTARKGICVFSDTNEPCKFEAKKTTIVPIYSAGERIGTLILARYTGSFSDDDLILSEYSATVVGMKMLRDYNQRIESETRKHVTVQIALETLSYSEIEAAQAILGELDGSEGLLVASKIADRVGITRSVIVNTVRKFEAAGVIESKSLGMKGTYIKIVNEYLLEELQKLKSS